MRLTRLAFAAVMTLGFASAAMAQTEIKKTSDGKAILTLCSGLDGGGYSTNGNKLAGAVQRYARVNNVNTAATVENLERAAGVLPGKTCDLLMYQADGVAAKKDDIPNLGSMLSEIRKMYPEAVHVVVTQKSKINKFDELIGKKVAVVNGSGSAVTLAAFGKLEPKYKNIGVESAEDWDQALDWLKDGRVQAVFYVGGLRTDFITKTVGGKPDQFFLAHLQNEKLEGSGYYTPKNIKSGWYKNLQGWYNTRTILVESTLGVRKDVEAALKDEPWWRSFRSEVSKQIDAIRAEQVPEGVLIDP